MPRITFDVTEEQLDDMVSAVLRTRIEQLQLQLDINASFPEQLEEDCQAVFHLMHAHNYLTPPSEHYDVPA